MQKEPQHSILGTNQFLIIAAALSKPIIEFPAAELLPGIPTQTSFQSS
jgi:hypothetical protein